MSKKKKIILVVMAVILLIVIGVCIFMYTQAKTTKVIGEEVENALIAISIGNDIDMSIKSNGDFAKLELYIKEKLNKVSKEITSYKKDMEDIKIGDVLRTENLENDMPSLKKSLDSTNKAVKNTNDLVTSIGSIIEYENVMNDMNNIGMSSKNKNVYKSVMKKPGIEKSVNNMIDRYKTKLDIYTKLNDIIKFLNTNKDKWDIDNGELKFRDQDKLNEYNSKLDDLSMAVNK